jgi:hypothetical protein
MQVLILFLCYKQEDLLTCYQGIYEKQHPNASMQCATTTTNSSGRETQKYSNILGCAEFNDKHKNTTANSINVLCQRTGKWR